LDWKGVVAAVLVGSVLAAAFWASSPYLQRRINTVMEGLYESRLSEFQTSTGERIEFWKKSVGFVVEAPVIGHGTGSIKDLFRKLRAQEGSTFVIDNPHNQTLAVAIQLGLIGVAVLYAMWLAHLVLFRHDGFADWVGLVIVIQNVIGSLFNSYLFDFAPGWLYVFGVGVAGGMVLRGTPSPPTQRNVEVATPNA
jgi:hypothetical protein